MKPSANQLQTSGWALAVGSLSPFAESPTDKLTDFNFFNQQLPILSFLHCHPTLSILHTSLFSSTVPPSPLDIDADTLQHNYNPGSNGIHPCP
jgi:hypothetical protein